MDIGQLRPLPRRPIEDLAVDSLRDFILSGAVPPGTRLVETALAEQLGIARATLRAGLQRLAGEGLVERTPYVGWQLMSLTAADAWEIWTLRGALERLASALVAQSEDDTVLPAARKAYDALVDACRSGTDMHLISERDFDLHRRLVELSGHARLARQYQQVEQQVRLYISTSNQYASDGPEDIIAQHEPLMTALEARDARAAGRAAWHHNETEGRRLAQWLETRESS